jgi:NitT/TauT family transport system substrate-binding protein
MRLRSLVLFTVAVLTLATAGTTKASDRITLVIPDVEQIIYLPAKLAEQLGYFKEQGLDVEFLSAPAGVQAEDALLSGAVQGAVGFYDHTIDLQARGSFAESVVQFGQVPGLVELVAAKAADKIKSPADWKGKTLGVTGLGSSTIFLTAFLAARSGLQTGDFTVLPVGTGNTFIAAMQQGRIDAGMTAEPTASRHLRAGDAKILIDLRTVDQTKKVLGGLYPASCVYMKMSWVESHPQVVQKLVNAFVKALHYVKIHSAQDIADNLPAEYIAGDKAMYVKALAGVKSMFTPDGRMPASGPTTVLSVLSTINKRMKGGNIDLSRTYTSVFVTAAAATLR